MSARPCRGFFRIASGINGRKAQIDATIEQRASTEHFSQLRFRCLGIYSGNQQPFTKPVLQQVHRGRQPAALACQSHNAVGRFGRTAGGFGQSIHKRYEPDQDRNGRGSNQPDQPAQASGSIFAISAVPRQ